MMKGFEDAWDAVPYGLGIGALIFLILTGTLSPSCTRELSARTADSNDKRVTAKAACITKGHEPLHCEAVYRK